MKREVWDKILRWHPPGPGREAGIAFAVIVKATEILKPIYTLADCRFRTFGNSEGIESFRPALANGIGLRWVGASINSSTLEELNPMSSSAGAGRAIDATLSELVLFS